MLSHWNLKISWDQMFTSKLDGQMIPHMLSASVKGKKVFPTLLSHQEQTERLKGLGWRRKWQPTAVFLLGKSHEQRSLLGYSPWGPKESDTT